MRKDLRNVRNEKVHTGKLISQGAHASMKAYKQADRNDAAFRDWDEGIFTKLLLRSRTKKNFLQSQKVQRKRA